MGKIIIIRHGNRLDFYDPLWTNRLDENLLTKEITNSPLSECGIKQSHALAEYLTSNFPNVKVNFVWIPRNALTCKYIFSSPYLRTLQTAHPICDNLKIPIFVENSVAEGGGDVSGHDLPCPVCRLISIVFCIFFALHWFHRIMNLTSIPFISIILTNLWQTQTLKNLIWTLIWGIPSIFHEQR